MRLADDGIASERRAEFGIDYSGDLRGAFAFLGKRI
jgi:hypothetical protein